MVPALRVPQRARETHRRRPAGAADAHDVEHGAEGGGAKSHPLRQEVRAVVGAAGAVARTQHAPLAVLENVASSSCEGYDIDKT